MCLLLQIINKVYALSNVVIVERLREELKKGFGSSVVFKQERVGTVKLQFEPRRVLLCSF
jgi:hypothetical protein